MGRVGLVLDHCKILHTRRSSNTNLFASSKRHRSIPLRQQDRQRRLQPSVENLLTHRPILSTIAKLHVKIADQMSQRSFNVVESETVQFSQHTFRMLIIRITRCIALAVLLTPYRGSLAGQLKRAAQYLFCHRRSRDHEATGPG